MPRFSTGLVVGKFAPLHLGHELLIRCAQSQCEKLIVLSYTKPEFENCLPNVRRAWLARRFPNVHVCVLSDENLKGGALKNQGFSQIPHNDAPASAHRRFVGAVCKHLLGVRIDAVFTSESYGDGFARELGEYYRQTEPDYSNIPHVCVDAARSKVPISATKIRNNVHAARDFLSPEVYSSFVRRLLVLGGESSGKSTLCRALARHFQTECVDEYGRELWERQNGLLSYEDMLKIGREQVRREDAALLQARRYLVCDTSPLTTLFYSREMFGAAASELIDLANRSYDHIFLCAPDFEFVQDGTRREPGFRDLQHEWYLNQFNQRSLPFRLVSGPVEDRVQQVAAWLESSGAQHSLAYHPSQ